MTTPAEHAATYPEHAKLAAVKDRSQAIGEFLDYGLGAQGLVLYEEREFTEPTKCTSCSGCGVRHSGRECEDCGGTGNGGGTYTFKRWVPAHKGIEKILATYFDIDQDKINAEKDAMLAALRAPRH